MIRFLPVITTAIAVGFSVVLWRHFRERRSIHVGWWAAGVAFYGAGTLLEALNTFLGWYPWLFRAWYMFGALFGAAPLAQGTVYLLCRRTTGHWLSAVLIPVLLVGSVLVWLSPINDTEGTPTRLTSDLLAWDWVRMIPPFVNFYALFALVGGAVYSAWHYARDKTRRFFVFGNIWIALGAFLPGVGGAAARYGHTEWLYVTELVGLGLIWLGYHLIRRQLKPKPQ